MVNGKIMKEVKQDDNGQKHGWKPSRYIPKHYYNVKPIDNIEEVPKNILSTQEYVTQIDKSFFGGASARERLEATNKRQYGEQPVTKSRNPFPLDGGERENVKPPSKGDSLYEAVLEISEPPIRKVYRTGEKVTVIGTSTAYVYKSGYSSTKAVLTNSDGTNVAIDYTLIKSLDSAPDDDVQKKLSEPIEDYKVVNFVSKKPIFQANKNFFKTGVYNGDVFVEYLLRDYTDNFKELNSTNDDVVLLIPKDFCISSGYNEDFVRKYVEEINRLEFASIEFQGIVEHSSFNLYKNSYHNNILVHNEFYKLYITSELSQFKFIACELLKMLYFNGNSNIPGLFMQSLTIFKEPGITPWQSFLLVVMIQNYYNEFENYALKLKIFSQQYNNGFRGSLLPNLFSDSNSLDSFKKKLANFNINKSHQADLFTYQSITPEECKELFDVKNNKDLNKFYNTYKKLMT